MRIGPPFPLEGSARTEQLLENALEPGQPGERIVVSFDPGLVRFGRVVAREGSVLEVEFPRRQMHTLAVGSRVPFGLGDEHGAAPTEFAIPDRTCLATERSEHGDARRYRLLLDDGPAVVPGRSPPRGHALRVDLRFGRLDFRAEVAGWPGPRILLRVALDTEAQLRATDAIELVHRRGADDVEIRLAGWIERRVLEGLFVRYEFRVDDQLAEDGALQRKRLRSLLSGEANPGAQQA